VQDAEQHRAAQQYPQALELLGLAVAVDGGLRPRLDAVRAEHERWIDAQYEAVAREGDALLSQRRFAEAQARYEAALRFRRGGRAEPLARYARALAHGEQAVQRRDWAAATAAYDEAVRTGMDSSAFAATELERVRIRPYAIRLRSVAVKPFRPDGAPWTGSRSRAFDRLVGRLASAALDRVGGLDRALDVYDALPHENRPNLYATLVLPDGRQFSTASQRAIRARLESSVVVLTNAYDDRPVWIRIGHAGADAVEIGAVSFRLMDAVAGELQLADRSIASLRVVGAPSPLGDGAAHGFVPAPAPQPSAPAPAPAPVPASHPPPRR
jgi:tetratricopeptide (TPR) repeat protein